MPMSTTWVFLGILAGREVAFTVCFNVRRMGETQRIIGWDLAKAATGLVVSVILALGLPLLGRAPLHEGQEKAPVEQPRSQPTGTNTFNPLLND